MTTGWRTPQEDEFALLCLGARSPYEGLIAAQDFGRAMKLADPADLPEKEERRWEKIFLQFFRAVWLSPWAAKRLVLKSPTALLPRQDLAKFAAEVALHPDRARSLGSVRVHDEDLSRFHPAVWAGAGPAQSRACGKSF